MPELMAKNMERLTFTTDYASAYRDAEVIFIGVGTPEKVDGSANLKYVYTVAKTNRSVCGEGLRCSSEIYSADWN